MKKVLILAYDFPPYNSIGGQRPYSWYLYFKEFGIEPIVVSRHWDVEINNPEDCYLPSKNQEVTSETTDHGTVIRSPFTPLQRDRLIGNKNRLFGTVRKLMTAWQMLTEHSLRSSDSRHPIYDAARQYLNNHKVDMIIATGEPFILFTHAYRLSKEFQIPWAADYRDGWSTNLHLQENPLHRWIQTNIHQPIEKRIVQTAALVTTAAPSFAKDISKLLGGKDVDVIYNGYFEEKFQNLKDQQLKEKFTIAHAGTVYPYQRVETMIEGLRSFVTKNPEKPIELIFYGLNFQSAQQERIQSISSGLPVKFTSRMPHDKMIQELASCHALLLLATPEKQQIYAKVFDYLALGAPILLVENDKGPLESILKERQNVWLCSNDNETAEAITQITEADPNFIATASTRYTRKRQAQLLAERILEITTHNMG